MKKNDGFTLIELLVTLVIVGVIMTFIISMMSSQYAIIRDVDAYLTISSENKDVNDAIIREFVKAENIYISLNGDDVLDANENILDSSFTISNLSNLGADGKDEGIDLEKVILTYGDDPTIISFTAPSETNTTTNEICIVTQIGNDGTPSSQTIGDHLASSIPVKAFFYKRLSLDRRVVALTKVKINYYHDGITKQYDLFYHLRNLDYSN